MCLFPSPGSSLEITLSAKEVNALAIQINNLQNVRMHVFCRGLLVLSHADRFTEDLTKEGANIWIFLIIRSILLREKMFSSEVTFSFLKSLGKFAFLKLSFLHHFWLSEVDVGIGIHGQFSLGRGIIISSKCPCTSGCALR